ncbi:MAG TPA: efflux RND transporter periplasmic adaptor subunit [Firmicutes bacterium]|nr:efflux RND transporter periplasmic adaptor subunit [Bacillota bacterium]
MKKFLLISLIVLIIAAGLWWFFKIKPSRDGNPVTITEHVVEKGSIVLSIDSTGIIAANQVVDIKCKASGEIIRLDYDISDPVSKGDLLVELDPSDELRNLEMTRVSVSQSQANLEKARLNLSIAEADLESARESVRLSLEIAQLRADEARAKANRMKQLFDEGFASEEEYQVAETAALTAEANVVQARVALNDLSTLERSLELKRQDVTLALASLESAQINLSIAYQRLEDTKVYSPIDGVITSRDVQVGQIISSGISNTGGGTNILTISDLSRIYVVASVDESDIGRVRPGQKVDITVDAFPLMSIEGIVERVAQEGHSVSNVVTFEVKIEVLTENKRRLMPGMTANVEIIAMEAIDVLSVPVGAVTREDDKQVVRVKKADGSIETREVQTGINNGRLIEIVDGLSEGDIVIIDESAATSLWRRDVIPPNPGGLGGMGSGTGRMSGG